MSARIQTPVNIKLATNIALVRIKKNGQRFEIACYKNKVIAWKNKLEKDIYEVLQSDRVFHNVAKGELAKKDDMQKAFGHTDQLKICMEILDEGELQVSPKEREQMYEQVWRDILTIVCNKTINPDTQRPYPPSIIERTMRDMHFAVKPGKSAKQQALELISKLRKSIPIERAQMRLKITISSQGMMSLKKKIEQNEGTIEKEDFSKEKLFVVVARIDPGLFRELDELCSKHNGTLDVMDSCVQQIGEMSIESLDAASLGAKKSTITSTTAAAAAAGAAVDEDDETAAGAAIESDEEEAVVAAPSKKHVHEDEGKRAKHKKMAVAAAAAESDDEEAEAAPAPAAAASASIAPSKKELRKNKKAQKKSGALPALLVDQDEILKQKKEAAASAASAADFEPTSPSSPIAPNPNRLNPLFSEKYRKGIDDDEGNSDGDDGDEEHVRSESESESGEEEEEEQPSVPVKKGSAAAASASKGKKTAAAAAVPAKKSSSSKKHKKSAAAASSSDDEEELPQSSDEEENSSKKRNNNKKSSAKSAAAKKKANDDSDESDKSNDDDEIEIDEEASPAGFKVGKKQVGKKAQQQQKKAVAAAAAVTAAAKSAPKEKESSHVARRAAAAAAAQTASGSDSEQHVHVGVNKHHGRTHHARVINVDDDSSDDE